MRAVVLVVALAAGLVVAGCSGPDATTPVPTEATDPYVCTGVPERSLELMLGGAVMSTREYGTWGLEGRGFMCDIARVGDGRGVVLIEEWDVGTKQGIEPEQALEMFALERDAASITAEAPGAGYAIGDEESGSAKWVCGERMLVVSTSGVRDFGRDQRADAEALLVSMLPWACDGEEVPERTVAE